MSEMHDALSPRREIRLQRVGDAGTSESADLVAVEEPLEIRIHDRPFVVIMRTPGSDKALTAGFLLAEGLIASADDVGAIEHCRHPDHPHVHNVVNAFLMGEAAARLPAAMAERRNVVVNASCGVCGRVTIESLRTRAAPLRLTTTITREVLASLPLRLRARQPLFEETGGLHAAALFDAGGECLSTAEDVGRHNAVDKVIGEQVLNGRLPLTGCALAVSGRASFEIIQKAWLGGVEIVCAVSAPSSLAVDVAAEAGITLIGFARERGFNIYSHPSRVAV